MLQILEESRSGVVGFKISGKVSAADYDVLLPVVEQAIGESGSINMLVLLEDFKGASEMEAVKKDFHFGTQQYRHVERCAFVGDKNWYKWMVQIMDPFTRRTEEKFFEPEQLEEAWNWAAGNAGS